MLKSLKAGLTYTSYPYTMHFNDNDSYLQSLRIALLLRTLYGHNRFWRIFLVYYDAQAVEAERASQSMAVAADKTMIIKSQTEPEHQVLK